MSQLADLIGALRLPTGAHRRVAGHRGGHRPAGAAPPPGRRSAGGRDVGADRARRRRRRADPAEQLPGRATRSRCSGELAVDRGLYREAELIVNAPTSDNRLIPDVSPRRSATGARRPPPGSPPTRSGGGRGGGRPRHVACGSRCRRGAGRALGRASGAAGGGEFAVIQDGVEVPFETPRSIRAELAGAVRAA